MEDYAEKLRRNVVATASGCWEWQGNREVNGYGRTRYMGRMWLAHRMAWTVLRGPIRKGHLVCHKCDNPPCCNLDHLFTGTHKANTRDAIVKGRQTFDGLRAVGHFRRKHKLSDADVDRIRSTDIPCKILAAEMGCTYHNIYFIRKGLRKNAPIRNTPIMEVT